MTPNSRSQEPIEIEERDQANNLVATYIQSFQGGAEEASRFDVIVSVFIIVSVFHSIILSRKFP
jgi:hypothetical protein